MNINTSIYLRQGDPVRVKTDSVIKRSHGKLNYYNDKLSIKTRRL